MTSTLLSKEEADKILKESNDKYGSVLNIETSVVQNDDTGEIFGLLSISNGPTRFQLMGDEDCFLHMRNALDKHIQALLDHQKVKTNG